jgi:hypothetical protein
MVICDRVKECDILKPIKVGKKEEMRICEHSKPHNSTWKCTNPTCILNGAQPVHCIEVPVEVKPDPVTIQSDNRILRDPITITVNTVTA